MLVMARIDQLIQKYTAMRDMYKQFNTEGAIATVKLCDEVLQDLETEKRVNDIEVVSVDFSDAFSYWQEVDSKRQNV